MKQLKNRETIDMPNLVGSVVVILTGMILATFSVIEKEGKFMDTFNRTSKKPRSSRAEEVHVN